MIQINQETCIGCGLCAADCIELNIEITDGKAGAKKDCFQCGHCVAVCPAGAVSLPEYDMEDVEEYEKESFTVDPEHLLHSIKFRRSIRKYADKKVEQELLEKLLQAGRYTATAKNNQDCCFVFVQEEQNLLKEKVWAYIDERTSEKGGYKDKTLLPYAAFNKRRKADPNDDFLFRDAPVVLYITSDWDLDAGLAAQNIETMAAALGLGALYNGFLARISNENTELKEWLGIQDKTIKACLLLGYPDVHYRRTAPRREAHVIWK